MSEEDDLARRRYRRAWLWATFMTATLGAMFLSIYELAGEWIEIRLWEVWAELMGIPIRYSNIDPSSRPTVPPPPPPLIDPTTVAAATLVVSSLALIVTGIGTASTVLLGWRTAAPGGSRSTSIGRLDIDDDDMVAARSSITEQHQPWFSSGNRFHDRMAF